MIIPLLIFSNEDYTNTTFSMKLKIFTEISHILKTKKRLTDTKVEFELDCM